MEIYLCPDCKRNSTREDMTMYKIIINASMNTTVIIGPAKPVGLHIGTSLQCLYWTKRLRKLSKDLITQCK